MMLVVEHAVIVLGCAWLGLSLSDPDLFDRVHHRCRDSEHQLREMHLGSDRVHGGTPEWEV
jgi:hypothetical protein